MTEFLVGNAIDRLAEMADHSVHLCVCSPPYWGLRSYLPATSASKRFEIGCEKNPQDFIDNLVSVFREVRRVLRPDGTLWVNLGDSYTDSGRGSDDGSTLQGSRRNQSASRAVARERHARPFGLGPKQLLMMPARFAIAMQQDGWILRMDIIWSKRNNMPESVRDRVTKSHEYIFHFAPSLRYYYDAEAIAEPISQGTIDRISQPNLENQRGPDRAHAGGKTNGTMKAVVRKSGNKERKFRGDHGGVEGSKSNQGFAVPWASDGSHRRQYKRALEIATEGGLTQAHLDAIRIVGLADTSRQGILYGDNKSDPEQLRLATEAMDVLGAYYREFLAVEGKRNKRSVWSISSTPFKGAHYATFPPKLIEPCILAGTSQEGCCPVCGAPWQRQTQRTDIVDKSANGSRFDKGKTAAAERGGDRTQPGERFTTETVGWKPSCKCEVDGVTPAPIPCTVLDPFGGAGTTGLVCQRLNRRAILIDLNPDNVEMSRERIRLDGIHGYQQSLEMP